MSRTPSAASGRVRILEAGARLFAKADYASVSMADLGVAADMGASTIYWHFKNKQEILCTLFDECLDGLLADQESAIAESPDDPSALLALVHRHADFVVFERATATTYYRQAGHIDAGAADRLRRKQRAYISRWAQALGAVRPELSVIDSEALVRAAIGAMQSDLFHRSAQAPMQRHGALSAIALRVLDVPTPI